MNIDAIVDSLVVAGSILFCVLIGVLSKRKDKKTVDDYLLGDRKLSIIPVAFSTFATQISANSFTMVVGESYANGMQIFMLYFGGFFGKMFLAFFIIPVFHNMSYVSVYEYVERRFDKSSRIFFSLVYNLISLIRCGTCLFIPAITITTVTGISYWIVLSVTGIVCTVYCVIGGFRAVVYTDFFQSLLMFGSAILVTVFVYVNVGFQKAWDITFTGQFNQHFRVTEDLENNYTVWNVFINGMVLIVFISVGSQATAQRFLCLKDYKTARNSFIFSQVIILSLAILLIFMTVAIFAATSNCNPMQDPNSGVRLPDQIVVYISAKLLKGYPGLLGFLLAGLISAALSTVSSYINAMATNTLEDFIFPLKPSLRNNEEKRLFLCKVLTGVYGLLTVVISLAVPYIGGILQVTFLLSGAFAGPTGAAMCVAFFVRNINLKACKLSVLLSLVFSVWMSAGSYLNYPHRPQFVHTKGQQCLDLTTNATFLSNINNTLQYSTKYEERGPSIYGIGSFWFPVMSAILTYLLIVVLTRIFGPDKEVDIRLLSPLVLTKAEREMVERMKYEGEELKFLKCQEKNEIEA